MEDVTRPSAPERPAGGANAAGDTAANGGPAGRARGARWAWVAAAGWAAAIFAASSIPARTMPAGRFWRADKLIHAAVFGALAALLWRALRRTWRAAPRASAVAAVALTGLYGVTDEWHQRFVPGRHASVLDALADAGGAIVAVAIAHFASRARRARRARQARPGDPPHGHHSPV